MAEYIRQMGIVAKEAAAVVAASSVALRNAALHAIAAALQRDTAQILGANAQDVEKARAAGLEAPLLARLGVDEKAIAGVCDGLRQVAALPDPVGAIDNLRYMPSGIQVGSMRIPLGVIGVIYESRPGVTADAAALCLKAGNAVILRGGSESLASNQCIAACIREGLRSAGLPQGVVQLVETVDRAAVGALITMPEYIDVIIPRGGASLVQRIDAEARVPVIRHLEGNCHVYVDDRAAPRQAHDIALNAKTQRYGVCNAMETLLVAEGIAPTLLPELLGAYRAAGVELRACDATRRLFPKEQLQTAQEEDWSREYLAPILALKIVSGLEEAIEHINRYGSGHTDAIVTEDHSRAWRFLRAVDSSSVLVNASTRFADGYEYGLGAEIGISTNKLHARGPVGIEGLTTKKFVVLGSGQIRR